MGDFYDINYKLYNMLDINGEKPEVFIADGNRTAGKSFSIKSKILKEALEKEDENQLKTTCRGVRTVSLGMSLM